MMPLRCLADVLGSSDAPQVSLPPASQATVRTAFAALVDSVVPIPRAGHTRSDAFGHRAA